MCNHLHPTANSLRIFIPDWTDHYKKPSCVPPVYPFLNSSMGKDELVGLFGSYVNKVSIVRTIEECDIALLMYELGYYYKMKKLNVLKKMNKEAASYNKLLVCWVKGDQCITPSLHNFHLYKLGGFKSKNKGNEFTVPVFIKDPLPEYFDGILPLRKIKSGKPLIGFCGQGKGGFGKYMIDIIRGGKNRIFNYVGKYPFDIDALFSSTYMRSKILDSLESSPLVFTNFIRHRKYRAGSRTEIQKKESSRIFFKNMGEVEYMVCYRGAGNFSVRLFETLASGKIPVIITSDNSLPLEDTIGWKIFPVVPEKDWNKTAEIVARFHARLSDKEFIDLQYKSRSIWEEYLSYKGFFSHWADQYISRNTLSVKKFADEAVDECLTPVISSKAPR